MERLWEALSFALACVAGVALFALGVRQVNRSRPGWGSRFFFHLSVVILGLGTVCGCTRPGKEPPSPTRPSASPVASTTPQITPTSVNLAGLQDAYDKLSRAATTRQSEQSLKDCQKSLGQALETVSRWHQARALSQEEAQYLSDLLRQLGERAQALTQGHEEDASSCCIRSLRDLNAQDQVLMQLNATQHFDPFLAGLLKDQVRGAFQALRRIPLKDRLAAGALSHEQYRELACRIQDNLFLYHRKSVASQAVDVVAPPPRDLEPNVCEYGVRPMPAPRQPPLSVAPKRAAPGLVTRVQGEVWIKQAGKNWALLTPGSRITTSGVLENKTAEAATLTAGPVIRLEGQAVVTGWELEPAGDDLP